MKDGKKFIKDLYDYSCKTSMAEQIIPLLYGLGLLLLSIAGVILFIKFIIMGGWGVVYALLTLLAYAVMVLKARVTSELCLSIIQLSKDIRESAGGENASSE
jgi:hypothetical protein